MFVLNYKELRQHIEETGIKQKAISEKTGMSETALCLVLQGKRKCEVGEYANICSALNIPVDKFLKLVQSEKVS